MAKKSGGQRPNTGGTVAVCTRLAQPVAEELGLLLWDVRFVKEGADWYLRFFIDREEEAVTINDCEAFSRRVDVLLDEADPIPCSYCLEVSSPGIERELTRPEHFERFMDWPVTVRSIRPVDGVREFSGWLAGYAGGTVTLEDEEGVRREFSLRELSAVRLAAELDSEAEEDAPPDEEIEEE